MALIRFYCPSCGQAFPWSARSQSYSLFEGARIECSRCGQISRIKVSIRKALWSYTLTAVLIFALLPPGAKHLGILIGELLIPLRDAFLGLNKALAAVLCGLVGGLVLGLILGAVSGLIFGIGFRQGFEVVIDKERVGPPSRSEKIQKWVEAFLPLMLVLTIFVGFTYMAVKGGWFAWYVYLLAFGAATSGIRHLVKRVWRKRRKDTG